MRLFKKKATIINTNLIVLINCAVILLLAFGIVIIKLKQKKRKNSTEQISDEKNFKYATTKESSSNLECENSFFLFQETNLNNSNLMKKAFNESDSKISFK